MSELEQILTEIEQCDLRGYLGEQAEVFAGQRGALVSRLGAVCAAELQCALAQRERLVELLEATKNWRARFAAEKQDLFQAAQTLESQWRQLQHFRPDYAASGLLDRMA
jgi:hypothetical protein